MAKNDLSRLEILPYPEHPVHEKSRAAGSSLLLTKGMLELTGPQGDVLTIEEGFAEHGYVSRRDHAYPLSPAHFNVFLTAYTPCDKTFRIGTKGFEKKDLLF